MVIPFYDNGGRKFLRLSDTVSIVALCHTYSCVQNGACVNKCVAVLVV